MKHAHAAVGHSAPHRILLLARSIFQEDMEAVLTAAGSIDAFTIPRSDVKALAEAFLPPEVKDDNYVSASPEAAAAMKRYRGFLKHFWRAFDAHGEIHAVVTANYVYYAEREFAGALEELNVPFITFQKENSWSPGLAEHVEWLYRTRCGPFFGRKVLVYSNQEKNLEVRAGVTTADRIEVVGMPRLDKVHAWRKRIAGTTPDRPSVLFASFRPSDNMPKATKLGHSTTDNELCVSSRAERYVADLSHSAHRAMVELARGNPDITVWIKTKGRSIDQHSILKLLGVARREELPKNLEIVHGGSPFDLIKEAAVVCGLQSTLLLEALAAGRPVLVPWYPEACHPEVGAVLFDFGDCVSKVVSADELITVAQSLARACSPASVRLAANTSRLLEDLLGNSDGRASERAARAIIDVCRKQSLGVQV